MVPREQRREHETCEWPEHHSCCGQFRGQVESGSVTHRGQRQKRRLQAAGPKQLFQPPRPSCQEACSELCLPPLGSVPSTDSPLGLALVDSY